MMGSKKVYSLLGASNHSDNERHKEDYYATDPVAINYLMKMLQKHEISLSDSVWENACGEGHLSKELRKYYRNVKETDLFDRGVGTSLDFLKSNLLFDGDIITNPPYNVATDWVYKSLDSVGTGKHVILLLRTLFLEGQKRYELFSKYPPKYVLIFSFRLSCAKNGDFVKFSGSAQSYSWFVWEKGYKGETIIDWIEK